MGDSEPALHDLLFSRHMWWAAQTGRCSENEGCPSLQTASTSLSRLCLFVTVASGTSCRIQSREGLYLVCLEFGLQTGGDLMAEVNWVGPNPWQQRALLGGAPRMCDGLSCMPVHWAVLTWGSGRF